MAAESASVALDMAFDRGLLVPLRNAVAAHASRLGLSGYRVEELVLVAHELASNAILHGGGGGRLRLWAADGLLWCEVSDTGPGLPVPDPSLGPPPATAASGGRGLWLARRLTDSFDVESGDGGTTVTIGVALPD
jgi:anti-sigma regulatory factor (Ser/Thr protein kinase)